MTKATNDWPAPASWVAHLCFAYPCPSFFTWPLPWLSGLYLPLASSHCRLCTSSLNELSHRCPCHPQRPGPQPLLSTLSSHPTVQVIPRKPESLCPGPRARLHFSASPGTPLGFSKFKLPHVSSGQGIWSDLPTFSFCCLLQEQGAREAPLYYKGNFGLQHRFTSNQHE